MVAVGVVLVGTATVLGLVLFRSEGFFEITLSDLTTWSVVVGLQIVLFLVLLYHQMTEPPVKGRTSLFGLFGAVCGLVAGVLYGVLGIDEACVSHGGIDLDCGWAVYGSDSLHHFFWPTFGVVVALTVILGTVGGVTAAWLTRSWQAPIPAMPSG